MCDLLAMPDTVTVEGSPSWLIADPDTCEEVTDERHRRRGEMALALPRPIGNADHKLNSLLTGERPRQPASCRSTGERHRKISARYQFPFTGWDEGQSSSDNHQYVND
jgi:hypothetical protein